MTFLLAVIFAVLSVFGVDRFDVTSPGGVEITVTTDGVTATSSTTQIPSTKGPESESTDHD